jgi:hypothetical protein
VISTRDLEWAAGFLEGEGSFCSTSSVDKGRRYYHERVICTQVDSEPVDRLARLFGGRVALSPARGNSKESFIWQVGGAKARGIMMTLFVLMTERRQQQIIKTLSVPKGGVAV